MISNSAVILCLALHVSHVTLAYKPVIFMHGILSNASAGDYLLQWIKQDHPGTETVAIDMFPFLKSLVNMNVQVAKIGQYMMDFMSKHPNGTNIICYSQGGLICRGVLERFKHNVDTFISLSAPQGGQFGVGDVFNDILPKLKRENVYRFAYTKDGQNISVSNYWNDPHHQDLYRKTSEFLAVINNDTANPMAEEYKKNFLRINRLVMIGGPDDGVITPWQSSHFGFYDEKLNVVEMKNQKWYTEDTFGLRTLDKRGGLFTRVIPDIAHTSWRTTKSVYKDHILPFLKMRLLSPKSGKDAVTFDLGKALKERHLQCQTKTFFKEA